MSEEENGGPKTITIQSKIYNKFPFISLAGFLTNLFYSIEKSELLLLNYTHPYEKYWFQIN